ncbi:MAG: S9 family peptidase, partial [Brevundimonas sp.]
LTGEGGGLREARIGDPEAVVRLQVEAPRRTWAPLLGPDGDTLIGSADGVRRLGPGAADAPRTLAATPDAVLVLERTGLSETLRLRTAAGDRRLDGVNAAFANAVLSAPRPIDHPDGAGRPTRSWLHLPVGRDPAEVRGLVVAVYPGGTESGYWAGPYTLTTGLRAEVLAGAGFAVLSPALTADGDPATRGDTWVREVDQAVDAALAAVPGLPGDRIAILGHSFGGYAALEIATRSSRYQSYVVSSGMSDLFGHWGEFIPSTRSVPEDGLALRNQQGWVEAGQGGLGVRPWEDPAAYVAASPFLRADRITAPVLLLTADQDYVPVSQSERMFSALHRLGGRSRLITYAGEHHNAWSPANIRDRYAQIVRWLEETLPVPAGQKTGAAVEP